MRIIIIGIIFSNNEIFSQKKINSRYTDDINWENPEWENPEIFEINREKPRATFYSYKSSQKRPKVNGDGRCTSRSRELLD